MNHEIHIYENAEEVSRSVAELIKNKAVTAATEGKHLNLAISGGNTPKMLFSLMAEEYAPDRSLVIILTAGYFLSHSLRFALSREDKRSIGLDVSISISTVP